MRLRCFIAALLSFVAPTLFAAEATIAVASNFARPAEEIADLFTAQTGHRVRIATGGTGKFYAQIHRGAPFDAFLSADEARPALLEQEGHTVAGSRFVYAVGRLVLWQPKDGLPLDAETLRTVSAGRIAIANPRLAPYGEAAQAVIGQLGLGDALAKRLVQGENIAQTYQFVASGNAVLGFVAGAQVMRDGALTHGSGWLVPAELHPPIRQAAVLLKRAEGNAAARGYLDFLRQDAARAIIRRHGYDLQ